MEEEMIKIYSEEHNRFTTLGNLKSMFGDYIEKSAIDYTGIIEFCEEKEWGIWKSTWIKWKETKEIESQLLN